MVNIDDFVKRLEIILDYYALNASSFADKIGVQRSSMSHLLSGRNKPSLDFVLKILDVFPEVDLYWILNGKGNFPKSEENTISKKQITDDIVTVASPISSNENYTTGDLFSKIENNEKEKIQSQKIQEFKNTNLGPEENEIEKIVFFYKNGTFKVYIP
ncbi:MAG: helix-turn-helix transcriptional regulator [Flavobacterium sp.]